jgi:hypothetical protein
MWDWKFNVNIFTLPEQFILSPPKSEATTWGAGGLPPILGIQASTRLPCTSQVEICRRYTTDDDVTDMFHGSKGHVLLLQILESMIYTYNISLGFCWASIFSTYSTLILSWFYLDFTCDIRGKQMDAWIPKMGGSAPIDCKLWEVPGSQHPSSLVSSMHNERMVPASISGVNHSSEIVILPTNWPPFYARYMFKKQSL